MGGDTRNRAPARRGRGRSCHRVLLSVGGFRRPSEAKSEAAVGHCRERAPRADRSATTEATSRVGGAFSWTGRRAHRYNRNGGHRVRSFATTDGVRPARSPRTLVDRDLAAQHFSVSECLCLTDRSRTLPADLVRRWAGSVANASLEYVALRPHDLGSSPAVPHAAFA